ncbi:hypothetical protein LPJ53_004554 [Coemansia erecta]|uniref:Uncharacterized protein n=1 Tax=Coemansia erecta TaxID=147472 RepID=A0A9W7XU45_9FUNG|nr:hypothetical protein LPJ53_004554 [Coemansia erecta]
MGQSASRTAARKAAPGSMRLPRTTTQAPSPAARTREQMLSEDGEAQAKGEEADSSQLADNLKRFLNPRELLTPITPRDPGENANVQALRSRREDDDVEVGVAGRMTARRIAQMLRERNVHGQEEPRVAAKYGVDGETLSVLGRFLAPAESEAAPEQKTQINAQGPDGAKR